MLHVTPAALTHLRQMLSNSRMPPGTVVRLARTARQRTDMTYAPPEADDYVVDDEHGPVLAIEASLARALDGLIFDHSQEAKRGTTEAGFIMRLPPPAQEPR